MSLFARATSALAVTAVTAAVAFAATPAALSHAADATTGTVAPTSGIVQRSGGRLVVNGADYRFTGLQIGLGASPARPRCVVFADDAVGPALVRARDVTGANAVRVWLYQSYGGPADWRRFDLVFAEARKAGVRVIATLTNHWGDCEPGTADDKPIRKTLPWYQSGYRSLDPGYSASYRDFVRSMAERYRDEPALLAWQLVNEAEANRADGSCDEAAGRTALRAFSDDMVGVIRSAGDPHLVNLGTIGSGQCGASGSDGFRYVHGGALDLCEAHDYDAPTPVPGDTWNGVATRIADCAALGKPLFMGEVGLQRGIQANGSTGAVTSETLQRRATLMEEKMRAQLAAGAAGFLVWQVQQVHGDGYSVIDGDPMEAGLKRNSQSVPPTTTSPVVVEPVLTAVTTTLSKRTNVKGVSITSVTTGAGPLTVGVRSIAPLTFTVTVKDAAGRILATRTAVTPYDVTATVPAGTSSIVVSGPKRTPFTLQLTHIKA